MPLTELDVKRVAEAVIKKLRKIDNLEFVRPAQIMEMLGCKVTYFYTKILTREGFPRALILPGSKVKVWRKSEVEEWAAKNYELPRK